VGLETFYINIETFDLALSVATLLKQKSEQNEKERETEKVER